MAFEKFAKRVRDRQNKIRGKIEYVVLEDGVRVAKTFYDKKEYENYLESLPVIKRKRMSLMTVKKAKE